MTVNFLSFNKSVIAYLLLLLSPGLLPVLFDLLTFSLVGVTLTDLFTLALTFEAATDAEGEEKNPAVSIACNLAFNLLQTFSNRSASSPS